MHAGIGPVAWLIDVAFASALVLITIGCFAPNAPLFGRVIDGTGVHDPVVAITFDDGPSPDTTPRVLDALRDADARATFFILGRHAEQHPKIVERMVREGHEIANHTYSHGILVFAGAREITRELLRTHRLLLASGARPPRLFRAPHGFRNPIVVRVARRLGYRVVGWTKGVFDTAMPGADVIADRSRKALRPGAILLLHDADGNGNGDRSQTADALPAILRDMREAGLSAVTVSELAALAPARQTSWKRIAFVVLGVAVIVTVIFQRTDRQQIIDAWEIFKTLSVPLVILALIANFASVWFKAVVWKTSLDTIPDHPRFTYRQVVPAIFIGFLLNAALVARLGEVGRMFVLRRRVQKDSGVTLRMPTIAGTLVMEQIVLGITLVVFVIMMIVLLPNVPRQIIDGVIALTGAVVALLVGVIAVELLARWRGRRHPDARHADEHRVELEQLPALRRGRAERHGERPRAAALAAPRSLQPWRGHAVVGGAAARHLADPACVRYRLAHARRGRRGVRGIQRRRARADHARQCRRLPARGRARAACQLRRRPDDRDHVRHRPAGDRGRARRRPRVRVPVTRRTVVRRGATRHVRRGDRGRRRRGGEAPPGADAGRATPAAGLSYSR